MTNNEIIIYFILLFTLSIINSCKINIDKDRITVLEEVCNDAFIEGDKK